MNFIGPKACAMCDEVEDTLAELVIAHKVIVVGVAGEAPGATVPVIKDKARLISEPQEISAYLKELSQFVHDWRRFQGDSCYIDENGQPC